MCFLHVLISCLKTDLGIKLQILFFNYWIRSITDGILIAGSLDTDI